MGCEDDALRKDTYAVISIQDAHNGGYGFEFTKNAFCRDVLTIYVDDIETPEDGLTVFEDEQGEAIINFILENIHVDTLLIHCYAGVSRSGAVGDFAAEILGAKNRVRHSFNIHIRNTLRRLWNQRKHNFL